MDIEVQSDAFRDIQRRIDRARGRFGSHVRIVLLGLSIIGYLVGLVFNIWAAFTFMILFSVVGTNVFVLRAEEHDFYGIDALERQMHQANALV